MRKGNETAHGPAQVTSDTLQANETVLTICGSLMQSRMDQASATFFAQRTGLKLNFFFFLWTGLKCFSNETARTLFKTENLNFVLLALEKTISFRLRFLNVAAAALLKCFFLVTSKTRFLTLFSLLPSFCSLALFDFGEICYSFW